MTKKKTKQKHNSTLPGHSWGTVREPRMPLKNIRERVGAKGKAVAEEKKMKLGGTKTA